MDIPKIRVQSITEAANFYRDRHCDNLTSVKGMTTYEKTRTRKVALRSMIHFLVSNIPGYIPEGTITMRF